MRRRDFIKVIGGAAVAWPLAASAQQPTRMRRIGVLVTQLAADDPEWQTRSTAFVQGLQQLDWTVGRNLRLDFRFGLGNADRLRSYAAELVALVPDILFAAGGGALPALQRETQTLPIVFANTTDPVGAGYVASLARPGGNATGFMAMEFGLSAKWLELLKQTAPGVTRVAVLRSPGAGAGTSQFAAIQAVAPLLGIEVRAVDRSDAGEIESAITTFARAPNGGLIVTQGGLGPRDLMIALAARYRVPAIYPSRYYVAGGGLISYGPDETDMYRRAAAYVDRILKGEKPADLPVQAPTKYETVLNMKTAKAIGLQVPDVVRLRADEVIE
jgi:putative tryptophan/tyrosine transport system substrate-binding protein